MQTSNRRMRERGAVFVEAVVIISFLTLALLGITFFHKLYVEKERAARLAGAAAIAFAMGACNGDATASIKTEMPKGQSGNSTQNNEPPPQKYQNESHSDSSQKALSAAGSKDNNFLNPTSDVTVSGKASSTTKSDGKTKGFSVNVSSKSFVSCSDETTDKDFEAVIGKIGDLIGSIVKSK